MAVVSLSYSTVYTVQYNTHPVIILQGDKRVYWRKGVNLPKGLQYISPPPHHNQYPLYQLSINRAKKYTNLHAVRDILQLVLVQISLFFSSSWWKIASAARKWRNVVPQEAATTFAFYSVFILLLRLGRSNFSPNYEIPSAFKNLVTLSLQWKFKQKNKIYSTKNQFCWDFSHTAIRKIWLILGKCGDKIMDKKAESGKSVCRKDLGGATWF